METKNNKVKLETIRRSLKFDSSSYVEPEGLSGGLALWWNKELKLDVELANKNFMHVIVTDNSNLSCWAATFVYGCPTRSGRVLRVEDKMGGLMPSQNSLSAFHEMISECGLVNLEFKGPKFTWRNNRSAENFFMEGIDMALANARLHEMHDQAMIFVEAAVGSDHNPLILNTFVPLNKVGKPFRFESFWVTEEDCTEIISWAWNQGYEGELMPLVCKKLKRCKEGLKEWNQKKFGDLRLRIATTKDKLMEVQKQLEDGFNPDNVAIEKYLINQLEDLWQKDVMYWHQRSRIKWLQMGDKNSRFFHLFTIQRRQRNQIIRLKDKGGTWRSEPKEIAGIIRSHFKDLYKGPLTRDFDDIISLIDNVISLECNASLVKKISQEEIKTAAFQMGALKAPGSAEFPGLFYQTYWDVVGDDVVNIVQNFFQEGVMLKEPFMDGIITEQQSAFILGRQVQDNIIVAHEVFHFLKHRKVGTKASMAVLLDLNKAYDRVFLFCVMEKMGFDGKWISWVKQCVCTVKYSIVVNRGQMIL
ncbi:hypothetical protein RHSIM_Rhsim02G0177800 [Rhododendron simsii]|uniref:Reverse transcriptase n=1 Tax=Rhododendron simsii TaxID=118357 RepID=A0A834HB26_RHOSS|nr:hypothetical protein RHSIM_Rhsim02G0177800 [Rhododendron simsii]